MLLEKKYTNPKRFFRNYKMSRKYGTFCEWYKTDIGGKLFYVLVVFPH